MKNRKRRLLTRSQAAEEFDVSLVTLDNWTRHGAPYQEIDGKRMYDGIDLCIWREFYDWKNNDTDFANQMKKPILKLTDDCHAYWHGRIWGWAFLNAGPRQRSEIMKRLAAISKLSNEIAMSRP